MITLRRGGSRGSATKVDYSGKLRVRVPGTGIQYVCCCCFAKQRHPCGCADCFFIEIETVNGDKNRGNNIRGQTFCCRGVVCSRPPQLKLSTARLVSPRIQLFLPAFLSALYTRRWFSVLRRFTLTHLLFVMSARTLLHCFTVNSVLTGGLWHTHCSSFHGIYIAVQQLCSKSIVPQVPSRANQQTQ